VPEGQTIVSETFFNPESGTGNIEALDQAAKIGIPNRKKEDWKFFPVDQYLNKWTPLTLDDQLGQIPPLKSSEEDEQICLRFPYDFKNVSEFELAPGLRISCSSDPIQQHALNSFHKGEFFPLINSGMGKQTLNVRVFENTIIQKPLRIIWDGFSGSGNGIFNPRINIHCEKGSQFKFIEDHSNLPSGAFVNSLIKTQLDEMSRFEFNQVQNFSLSTIFISYHQVVQDTGSVFHSNVFSFSGGMIRNNMQASLQGKGADTIMNGLFIPSKGQVIDNHTIVDHVSEACTSNENYKGIVFDKGTGVFNGKIFVRSEAQKTRAFQSNKNILLGKNPTIHTKPQLEIWADDVKCTHGATTGRLDDEQLFYLRSRGIDQDEAERMLTFAFANEIVEKLSIPTFKKEVSELLQDLFSKIDG
jgi:Fe-S cluster assembly protein SufD